LIFKRIKLAFFKEYWQVNLGLYIMNTRG
jgi:hypothetical protein